VILDVPGGPWAFTEYRPIDQNGTVHGTTPVRTGKGNSIHVDSQAGVTLVEVQLPFAPLHKIGN
jgi:hypothetical protein